MVSGIGNVPYNSFNAYEDFGSGMEQEKQRAKRDQYIAAKDMNDAKKDSYDKATIQARN